MERPKKKGRKRKKKIQFTFLMTIIFTGFGMYFYIGFLTFPGYELEPGLVNAYDIFIGGQDGYHTYRIPAIISLPGDVIIAFCEGRKDSCSDYGDIDLVMKRSTDNGVTWSDLVILWDSGTDAIMNPMPIYDKDTGMLLLAVVLARREFYILNSTDLGATWNEPWHIQGIKPVDWKFFGPSPGHGIQLTNGRLLISGMYNTKEPNAGDSWGSFTMYSDDDGLTWLIGHVFPLDTNECLSVELWDESILTILRWNYKIGNANRVYTSVSTDRGETYSNIKPNPYLISPICQASIQRFTKNDTYTKNRLIFSNPANEVVRRVMTLKISYDEGNTWPVSRVLYKGPSVYSDLCVLPNMTICCIFERGYKDLCERTTFVQFNLDWLSQGSDELILR